MLYLACKLFVQTPVKSARPTQTSHVNAVSIFLLRAALKKRITDTANWRSKTANW